MTANLSKWEIDWVGCLADMKVVAKDAPIPMEIHLAVMSANQKQMDCQRADHLAY